MRFFITCDIYWETKIDKVIDEIEDSGFKEFFGKQDYGDSLKNLTIVLVCQSPKLKLKQRIRYSKNEKKIYMDILFDFDLFLKISYSERREIVAQRMLTEIPLIISKFNIEEFNLKNFETHLKDRIAFFLKGISN